MTPEVGGEIWISWGPGMEGGSQIEIWEPNRHQRISQGRGKDREPSVIDFQIEARDGETTTLRLVQSGFGEGANFDDEVESTSHAWPLFLLLLKLGAERGYRRAKNVSVFRLIDMPREEAWQRLQEVLPSGERIHFDPFGNVYIRMPGGNLLAVFCEKCGGSTSITVMYILYDATPEEESSAKGAVEEIASSPVAP